MATYDAPTEAAEAPPSPTHVTIRREDYRPPDWLVPEIALDFALDPERRGSARRCRSSATASTTARCGSTATS